jgi:hypothetical protein
VAVGVLAVGTGSVGRAVAVADGSGVAVFAVVGEASTVVAVGGGAVMVAAWVGSAVSVAATPPAICVSTPTVAGGTLPKPHAASATIAPARQTTLKQEKSLKLMRIAINRS